jgi:hypothetical protein
MTWLPACNTARQWIEQLAKAAVCKDAEMFPQLLGRLLAAMDREWISDSEPGLPTLVSENGCQPKSSANALCQLARFSVDVTTRPPGLTIRRISRTKFSVSARCSMA